MTTSEYRRHVATVIVAFDLATERRAQDTSETEWRLNGEVRDLLRDLYGRVRMDEIEDLKLPACDPAIGLEVVA